jgi:hypothetical protein
MEEKVAIRHPTLSAPPRLRVSALNVFTWVPFHTSPCQDYADPLWDNT